MRSVLGIVLAVAVVLGGAPRPQGAIVQAQSDVRGETEGARFLARLQLPDARSAVVRDSRSAPAHHYLACSLRRPPFASVGFVVAAQAVPTHQTPCVLQVGSPRIPRAPPLASL